MKKKHKRNCELMENLRSKKKLCKSEQFLKFSKFDKRKKWMNECVFHLPFLGLFVSYKKTA